MDDTTDSFIGSKESGFGQLLAGQLGIFEYRHSFLSNICMSFYKFCVHLSPISQISLIIVYTLSNLQKV